MPPASRKQKASSHSHTPLLLTCGWMLLAALSFYMAQTWGLGFLMVPCSFGLLQLSLSASWRQVFYPLLLVGLLLYSPQLGFFWTIFGPGACLLWLLVAIWIPLFGVLVHLSAKRFARTWLVLLAPVLWTGLEYFRSEVYALRFTWLTLGSSFWATPYLTHGVGVYGLGFGCMLVAAILLLACKQRKLLLAVLGLVGVLGASSIPMLATGQAADREDRQSTKTLEVAGLQLEFPSEDAVLAGLNHLIARYPRTQLIVLSEYTFAKEVPSSVCQWCRRHKRFLVVGGTKRVGSQGFYNMAFVIGPTGKVEFEQAKSRPIQFFKDGLPAPRRRVWHSPWGKVGILICFDLSYAQVTDDFVRQGARLLLVPTMDVAGWGAKEHELNRRVAPLRAGEYGISIFRLGSSGVSQMVDERGKVRASATFPGQGDIIHGSIALNSTPRLPLDRILAPLCVMGTLLVALGFVAQGVWQARRRRILLTHAGTFIQTISGRTHDS